MNGYNFTERVRKFLAMAREEAARLHHEYVGTEHILLGLIREGEGVAAAVLTAAGRARPEVARNCVIIVGGPAARAGPSWCIRVRRLRTRSPSCARNAPTKQAA